MPRLIFLPPAARYLKKLKDKQLRDLFQKTIDEILIDPSIGEAKSGDLADIYCYDFHRNKIKYELAYTIVEMPTTSIVIILAGTRENFYEQLKRYLRNV